MLKWSSKIDPFGAADVIPVSELVPLSDVLSMSVTPHALNKLAFDVFESVTVRAACFVPLHRLAAAVSSTTKGVNQAWSGSAIHGKHDAPTCPIAKAHAALWHVDGRADVRAQVSACCLQQMPSIKSRKSENICTCEVHAKVAAPVASAPR